MGLRKKIFDIGFGCASLIVVGTIGFVIYSGVRDNYPDESSYRFKTQPVEQVFRDHNGYRTYHTDSSGKLLESHHSNRTDSLYEEVNPNEEIQAKFRNFDAINDHRYDTVIYRDVELGKPGYLHSLQFKTKGGGWGKITEIHIPKTQNLEPGNDEWGGKIKKRGPMGKIE